MEARSGHRHPRTLGYFSRLAVCLIERYQSRGGGDKLLLVDCNFEPTCSEYTKQSVVRFGFLNGARLGFARIRKCNDRECVQRKPDPPPLDWKSPSMLNKELVSQQEEEIRVQIRELSDDQKQQFYKIVNKKIKDPDTYAALNYSFFFGLHHFYLGRYLRWVVEFTLAIMAIAMLFNSATLPVGILFLVAVSISEIYDLFRSEVIIQDFNNLLMKKVLEQFKAPHDRFRKIT